MSVKKVFAAALLLTLFVSVGKGQTPAARLDQWLEDNGVRILSEKSVDEMQVDRITPDVRVAYSPVSKNDIGYGFGEWVVRGDSRTVKRAFQS